MKPSPLRQKKSVVLLLLAGIFLFLGGICVWAITIRLPDLSSFAARKIANSSKITDRTGEVILYDIHQSVRRTEIPLSEMGENIKNATIAIEDQNFYTHKGIRPTSILRAILVNLKQGGFSQGGSTITQQIIKNTLLSADKTVVRKIKEWVLALKLERHFSKEEILQIYLNDNPYGGTIYGIEEASQAFLKKHAKDLSLAEAAYMAAIPKAPTYYSPFGKNKDKLDERKNLVLKKMYELNYISKEQYETSKKEVVVFNTDAKNSIKAPHFVFYILEYLEEKYGREVMESGGYTIKTTLDYDLQKKAEEIVLKRSLENQKTNNASNSAAVVLDPKTGQILALVGSRDYFDTTIDGAYNTATAERQPGSAFKPIVYAAGFLKGYTTDTILFDIPTEFSTTCPDKSGFSELPNCYNPKNFDNKFKGPMKVRNALAESRNVPAVKMMYLVGLDDALLLAKKMGISTLKEKVNYGLSLVLGGGEATLLDMVSAYGVFANSGIRNTPVGILSITDRKGDIIEEFQKNEEVVFEKNIAFLINDILSDPIARAPTFGNSLTIPNVAFKTGTTDDNRDAWIIGYTPSVVVGVWSGNNNNTPMKKGGAAISGPAWKDIMEEILPHYEVTPFEKPTPEDSELKPILRGVWINETVGVQDILYFVNKDNPRGPVPNDPFSDPQFSLWNSALQRWWEQNKQNYPFLPSTQTTQQNNLKLKPEVSIVGLPVEISKDDQAVVSIINQGSTPVVSVDVFINDNYTTTIASPFRFVFRPKEYGYLSGNYTFKIVATNTEQQSSERSQRFSIR